VDLLCPNNRLLNLAGQVSVVFIYAMEALKGKDGSFRASMLMLAALMIISVFLIMWLKESKIMQAGKIALEPE